MNFKTYFDNGELRVKFWHQTKPRFGFIDWTSFGYYVVNDRTGHQRLGYGTTTCDLQYTNWAGETFHETATVLLDEADWERSGRRFNKALGKRLALVKACKRFGLSRAEVKEVVAAYDEARERSREKTNVAA